MQESHEEIHRKKNIVVRNESEDKFKEVHAKQEGEEATRDIEDEVFLEPFLGLEKDPRLKCPHFWEILTWRI